MGLSKKEIIIRLLKQIYDLIDYNLELKKEREELEKKLLEYENK
jgi:hypothetical protein